MRRNLLGIFAFGLALSALGNSPAVAQFRQFENSFRQIAREIGFGWGDGYHGKPSSPLVQHEYRRFTTLQQWPIVPAAPCPSTWSAPQTYNIPPNPEANHNSWQGQDFGYHSAGISDYTTTQDQAVQQPLQLRESQDFTPADQDGSSTRGSGTRDYEGSGTREPVSREDEYKQFEDLGTPAPEPNGSEWIPPGKEEAKSPIDAEIDSNDDILDKEVMDDEQYYREIEEMLRGSANEKSTPATNPGQPAPGDAGQFRRFIPSGQPSFARPGIKQATPRPTSPVRTQQQQPYDESSNVWW